MSESGPSIPKCQQIQIVGHRLEDRDSASSKIIPKPILVPAPLSIVEIGPQSEELALFLRDVHPAASRYTDKTAFYKNVKFRVAEVAREPELKEHIETLAWQIEHVNIYCDGPSCRDSEAYIRGPRYKCCVCSNVDFCSECVASPENKHDADHEMFRFLLPVLSVRIEKREVQLTQTEARKSDTNTIVEERQSAIRLVSQHVLAAHRVMIKWVEGNKASGFKRDLWWKVEDDGTISIYNEPATPKLLTSRERGILHHDIKSSLDAILRYSKPYEFPDSDEILQQLANRQQLIRLIEVKPGNLDDRLEIAIRLVNLKDNPAYEVLSYMCKEAIDDRCQTKTAKASQSLRNRFDLKYAVYCGNHFVTVTAGLLDALRGVRDPVETRTFWTDQLSINQEHPAEQYYMIQIIRYIYDLAVRVILWVGEEDEGTAPALNLIQTISAALQTPSVAEEFRDPFAFAANFDVPPFDSNVWTTLARFLTRSVNGRAWIAQKLITARTVQLRCGGHILDSEDLCSVVDLVSSPKWMYVLGAHFRDHRADLDASAHIINNYFGLALIIKLHQTFNRGTMYTMEDMVYMTRLFQVSDPRDRIYALLGTRGEHLELHYTHDHPDCERFKVRYTSPIEEVYTRATRYIMREAKSFAICGRAEHAAKSMQGLPSWVPDYHAMGLKQRVYLSQRLPPSPFKAAGHSEHEVHIDTAFPELLDIKSYHAETITSAGLIHDERLEHGFDEVAVAWTTMASMIQQPCIIGQSVAVDFLRTCLGDMEYFERSSPAPEGYLSALAGALIEAAHRMGRRYEIRDTETCLQNRVLTSIATDLLHVHDEGHVIDQSTQRYAASQFEGMCARRRFFTSSGGYMGIGPDSLKIGDEVHIIRGSRVPFVLHRIVPVKQADNHIVETKSAASKDEERADADVDEKDPSVAPHGAAGAENIDSSRQSLNAGIESAIDQNPSPTHTLVGECYVHGIMKGEALTRHEFEWSGACLA